MVVEAGKMRSSKSIVNIEGGTIRETDHSAAIAHHVLFSVIATRCWA